MTEHKAAIYEWHNGQLRVLEHPKEGVDLEQVLLDLPAGTYEALRTRDQAKFFRLDRHLERGVAGCKASGLPEPDPQALCEGINAAARHFAWEAKLRIDFLPHPSAMLDMRSTVLLSFHPLQLPPQETYQRGVGVYPTSQLKRFSPVIKGTAFIAARTAHKRLHEDDFEPILLDPDGYCLEGVMSNFFCFRGDTLHTAGTGVLGGITRETLLACAAELGLQVVEEAVHENQINRMNEGFLSSSVRGVLPVVRFAGKDIGNGKPGPRTLALDAAYGELVRSSSRPALPSDESA